MLFLVYLIKKIIYKYKSKFKKIGVLNADIQIKCKNENKNV